MALCTYNGEKYILEQLTSIVHQTVLPNEIVICDDNSSDSTVSLIDSFIQTHKNSGIDFKFVTNATGRGVTKNFENAIKRTTGEIIFLCDQDDIWMDNKIETILSTFENHDVKLVFHDAQLLMQNENTFVAFEKTLYSGGIFQNFESSFVRIDKEKYLNTVLSGCFIQGMCMAFKRELMKLAYPFPVSRRNHDAWILFCAIFEDSCIAIKDVLSLYRIHNNNLCGLDEYKAQKSISLRISTYDQRSMDDIMGDYYWCRRVIEVLHSDYSLIGNREYSYLNYNANVRIKILQKNRILAAYNLARAYRDNNGIYNHRSAYMHDLLFCTLHTAKHRKMFLRKCFFYS